MRLYKQEKNGKTNTGGKTMVLVFILLGSFIFLVTLSLIILLSTIQIKIQNLELGNKEIKQENRIKEGYEIKITFYFLEKIPIFWLHLNQHKIKQIYDSKAFEKIDFKKIEKRMPLQKEIVSVLKALQIRYLQLRIFIGTEEAPLTSYITAFVASIIAILLPHVTTEKQRKDCYYMVQPLYQNKNEYHIHLDSIICIKIVHIIYSMLLTKKGREKDERTSNRRSYAYRYE